MKLVALSLAALIGAVAGASAKLPPEQQQKLPPPAARAVEFQRDIQPIFAASCVKCHGRGKAKGGFKLDTRESFLKGGDSGAPAET
ncbi:MAG TPA: c-type cytochrome domain-containing protein, partial [Verrucomicrobiae bacterium]|nr:c-type cytochrome domain-containing protein [Verrucomicrobiae bacterium]